MAERRGVTPKVLLYETWNPNQLTLLRDSMYHHVQTVTNRSLPSNFSYQTVRDFTKSVGTYRDTRAAYAADYEKTFGEKNIIGDQPGVVAEYTHEPFSRFVEVATEPIHRTLVFSRHAVLFPERPNVQKTLWENAVGAFAGCGEGGAIADGMAEAGLRQFKLADGGTILPHDISRPIGAGAADIGENHAVHTAKLIYARNPYAKVDTHAKYVHEKDGTDAISITNFLDGATFLVEEVDNLPMKIAIREAARDWQIPVFMATAWNRGGVVQVHNPLPNEPIMGDLLSEHDIERAKDPDLDPKGKNDIVAKMVGQRGQTDAFLEKALEKGHKFWPQTGASARISSGALVNTIIDYLANKPVPEHRMVAW